MKRVRTFLQSNFSRTDIRATRFAFKVWLATTLLAPVFTAGYYGFADISFKRMFATYVAFVGAGAALSAPSFLVFAVLSMVVAGMHWEVVQQFRKTILSILGVILTAIPFSLIGVGLYGGDILIFMPYACFVVAGTWFFKLGKETDDEPMAV